MAIAIGLTALLLTLLFRFLVTNAAFEKKVNQAAFSVLERQRFIERLDSVLTNLQPSESGGPLFYTAPFPDNSIGHSLVVSFNAGIDPDPDYSGVLLGRIYRTEQNELVLGYWQGDKKGFRTEVLLKNVQNMEWQFLGPALDKDPTTILLGNGRGWLKQWPKNQGGAPEIIRLKIWCGADPQKQEEAQLQLAFILPVLTPISVTK
jgi:hypothetical protein